MILDPTNQPDSGENSPAKELQGRPNWNPSRPGHELLEALRKEQQAGQQKPAPKEGHVERQYPPNAFPGPAAWIDGDWKLLVAKGPPKLFNLARDMTEKNDLAAQHPTKVNAACASVPAGPASERPISIGFGAT